MNKLLFLILTLVVLIVAMYVFDIIAGEYLVSDYYVPMDTSEMGDDGSMPFEEYMGYIRSGEDPGIEDFSELPWDIKMINFRSMVYRVFIFVVAVVLSVFGGFVMKENRVDFSLLQLDPAYRIVNMARIAMFVTAVMIVIITAQRYASVFLLGWLYPAIWLIILAILIVWILNIIYAIKDNRAAKLYNKIERV